jgi:hypothetical protein
MQKPGTLQSPEGGLGIPSDNKVFFRQESKTSLGLSSLSQRLTCLGLTATELSNFGSGMDLGSYLKPPLLVIFFTNSFGDKSKNRALQ